MKLNDNSPWLTAKKCKTGDTITLLDEGQWKESTKFTYDNGEPVRQLVFKVEHEGEEKQLSIIKPSRLALIEAYGDDTVEWMGKSCKIALALNTQGGKSIILEPCPSPTPPAPRKKPLTCDKTFEEQEKEASLDEACDTLEEPRGSEEEPNFEDEAI